MEMTPGRMSPEAMFRIAQGFPDARLAAVLAGKDASLPQFVAQAVLSERQRIRQAQAGQQAQAQMAQQQPTKKDELLAGVASVAPDSVAQMAGGGIVAFSGESGNQEVRQTSRGLNEAYRRTGTLLPETSGYEGMGALDFLKRIFSEGTNAVSRADERLKRLVRQSALPEYKPDISTSDLPSTATSRYPVESAPMSAPASAPAPTRSAGSGGEGAGRAAAPAAAAPNTIDAASYFKKPEGERPSLGVFSVTNPYAKPKTAEEYINEQKELLRKFGVEENPYKEREAEIRAAQAGEAEKRRMAGLSGLANFGLMLAGAPKGRVGEAIGIAGQRAMQKYEADTEKLAALEEKRKEAMQAIRIANNEIKRGHVADGLRKLDAAETKRADADLKISELRSRHEQTGADIAAKTWGAEYDALSRQGASALGADIEMRKMAQQAQLSREEIAAKLQAARIAAAASAARGERTSIEMEVYKSERAAGKSAAEAYAVVMGIKKPATGVEALLSGAAAAPARPPGAVQPAK